MIIRTPTGCAVCTHGCAALRQRVPYVKSLRVKKKTNQQAVYVNLYRRKERRTSIPTDGPALQHPTATAREFFFIFFYIDIYWSHSTMVTRSVLVTIASGGDRQRRHAQLVEDILSRTNFRLFYRTIDSVKSRYRPRKRTELQ